LPLYTFCTICSSLAGTKQKGKYDTLPLKKMHLRQSAYSAVGSGCSASVFLGRSSKPKDTRLVRLRFSVSGASDSALLSVTVLASLPKIPSVARLKKLLSLRAARKLTVPSDFTRFG